MARKKADEGADNITEVTHLVTIRAKIIAQGEEYIVLEDDAGRQTELRAGYYPPSVRLGQTLEWVVSGAEVA